MSYERITADPAYDAVRPSHEWRYKFAAKYIEPRDVVIDAASGTGYGRKFLGTHYYVPVDRAGVSIADEGLVDILQADLNTWQPNFDFDVFVSIETIEHLSNAGVKNLLTIAAKARKYAIISTPIIPTKHRNEFHTQDFTFDQLKMMLPKLVTSATQDSGDGTIKDMYGIAVFKTA